MNGHGIFNWWGFSPPIDFLGYIKGSREDDEVVQIVMIGAGDPRHLLLTLARWGNYGKRFKVYVAETQVEVYARLLLLVGAALQVGLGLRERAALLLDLWANLYLRPASRTYLEHIGRRLSITVTDPSHYVKLVGLINADKLKYRDRDSLDAICRSWYTVTSAQYDPSQAWDKRLRQLLGTRYDYKQAEADWAWHMRLSFRIKKLFPNSSQCDEVENEDGQKDGYISVSDGWGQEFMTWRKTGCAFVITTDSPSSCANTSLAADAHVCASRTQQHQQLGYWGDMLIGPFPALALASHTLHIKNIHGSTRYSGSELALNQLEFLLKELWTNCVQGEEENEEENNVESSHEEDENKDEKEINAKSSLEEDEVKSSHEEEEEEETNAKSSHEVDKNKDKEEKYIKCNRTEDENKDQVEINVDEIKNEDQNIGSSQSENETKDHDKETVDQNIQSLPKHAWNENDFTEERGNMKMTNDQEKNNCLDDVQYLNDIENEVESKEVNRDNEEESKNEINGSQEAEVKNKEEEKHDNHEENETNGGQEAKVKNKEEKHDNQEENEINGGQKAEVKNKEEEIHDNQEENEMNGGQEAEVKNKEEEKHDNQEENEMNGGQKTEMKSKKENHQDESQNKIKRSKKSEVKNKEEENHDNGKGSKNKIKMSSKSKHQDIDKRDQNGEKDLEELSKSLSKIHIDERNTETTNTETTHYCDIKQGENETVTGTSSMTGVLDEMMNGLSKEKQSYISKSQSTRSRKNAQANIHNAKKTEIKPTDSEISTDSQTNRVHKSSTDSQIDRVHKSSTDSQIDRVHKSSTDSQIDRVHKSSTDSQTDRVHKSSTDSQIDRVHKSSTDSQTNRVHKSSTDSQTNRVHKSSTDSQTDRVHKSSTDSQTDRVHKSSTDSQTDRVHKSSTDSQTNRVHKSSTDSQTNRVHKSSTDSLRKSSSESEHSRTGSPHRARKKSSVEGGRPYFDYLEPEGVEVVLLSPSRLSDLSSLPEVEGGVDLVYVSAATAHLITPTLLSSHLTPNSTLILETVQMFPELTDNQVAEYERRMSTAAKEAGWERDGPDPLCHLTFRR